MIDKATFINQRNDRLVVNAVFDRVFVDQLAEFCHRVLLTFHQRRSGKADITRVGKDIPHLGCHQAVIGAVAFVDQHKHIARQILGFLIFSGVEFVDDTGDDVSLGAVHQFNQMSAAGSSRRVEPCMRKGGCDLLV